MSRKTLENNALITVTSYSNYKINNKASMSFNQHKCTEN